MFRSGNGATSPAGTLDIGATPTRCNALLPAGSYPRFEAGASLVGRTKQCTLKAVSVADYAGYAGRNAQWTGTQRDADIAAISAAFPSGVCNYSKPGLMEQPPLGTWIQVTGLGEMKALRPLR